jgi:RNA polymerase sigma-54 factor
MLKLSQHQKLMMKLTPQQVQYLKLLQLPLLSLEQRIKAELEINPLLEEGEEADMVQEVAPEETEEPEVEATVQTQQVEVKEAKEDKYSIEDFMNDDLVGYKAAETPRNDDDEREEMPIAADVALYQKLRDQVGMLSFDLEENLLAEEIIGNIDEDGYLRRPLENIIDDVNLSHRTAISKGKAENVLSQIQRLDPPGIGARNLQECLVAQLEVVEFDQELKELALKMLTKFFEDFTMKHYEDLAKNLNVTIDRLKQVMDLIQKLNPKPGEGQFTAQQNYVVPDFIVEHDDDDLIVTLNEKNVPPLRINKNYKEMMSRKKKNTVSAETKDFIRKRFEAAKWFINSIYQRRETMLKVMRTIIEKQREFFDTGENLKPMIYKDIASVIGMDISTISRVVNGKYVQTEYGTFELRHFFSDRIATSSGEDMSNKEVKNKIIVLIETEPPDKPYSDDKIAEILNKDGMFVARRTVAKYREQLKIPIARLRRKI